MPKQRVMKHAWTTCPSRVSDPEGRVETYINLLELETAWKACQQLREEIKGKVVSCKIDNTIAVSYLWKEDGLWKENLALLPQGWSQSLSIVTLGSSKSESRCPVQKKGSWMEPRGSCLLKTFQKKENSDGGLFVSRRAFKIPQYFSADFSNIKPQEEICWRV